MPKLLVDPTLARISAASVGIHALTPCNTNNTRQQRKPPQTRSPDLSRQVVTISRIHRDRPPLIRILGAERVIFRVFQRLANPITPIFSVIGYDEEAARLFHRPVQVGFCLHAPTTHTSKPGVERGGGGGSRCSPASKTSCCH